MAAIMSQPTSGVMRVGFHIPGIIAGYIAKGVEFGRHRSTVISKTLKLQQQIRIRCCGNDQALTAFRAEEIGALYDLAARIPYADFLTEVETRYAKITFSCLRCGKTSQLRSAS